MSGRRSINMRLRDERGITVLLSLFVLALTTLILGAVYQAVATDTQGTRLNLDQARAYAAAQAGIAQYTYELNQNPNYWQGCPSVTNVKVPNSTDGGSSEYYTYAPLAATTAPANDRHCDTSNPSGTMLEGSSSAEPGTFRVAFSGYSGTLNANGTYSNPIKRELVAQFRQPSFLDYVYYTEYEALDPVAISPQPTGCAAHWPNRGNNCQSIWFLTGDAINGPLHSEDTLAICSVNGVGPVFGRTGHNDKIEAAGTSAEGQSNCDSTPAYTVNNTSGSINTQAPSLTPPSTNGQLLSVAQASGYVYTGRTTIVLNNNTMSVTTASPQSCAPYSCPTGSNVSWPSNGVIYVKTASTGCPIAYSPSTAYNDLPPADNNCGNVYVSGNYTSSLTIASDNDVIINGNITTTHNTDGSPSGTQELGLIANDFVRLAHPVSTGYNGCTGNAQTGDLQNPTIYAAILAVNHSFIVDDYDCGSPLGTLTIWGALAQLFRGTVGTFSANNGQLTISSGYYKNYNYDDRLAYSEPPYFLNPTSTAWYVSQLTECGSSC